MLYNVLYTSLRISSHQGKTSGSAIDIGSLGIQLISDAPNHITSHHICASFCLLPRSLPTPLHSNQENYTELLVLNFDMNGSDLWN